MFLHGAKEVAYFESSGSFSAWPRRSWPVRICQAALLSIPIVSIKVVQMAFVPFGDCYKHSANQSYPNYTVRYFSEDEVFMMFAEQGRGRSALAMRLNF